jgi:regulator of sigma E protease
VIGYVGATTEAKLFRSGDEIVAVDDKNVRNFSQIAEIIIEKPDTSIRFKIKRSSELIDFTVKTSSTSEKDRWGNIYKLGQLEIAPRIEPIVGDVMPKSSAAFAGFKSADVIVSANGDPIFDFTQFRDVIRNAPAKLVEVVVLRDGKRIALKLTPAYATEQVSNGKYIRVGRAGIQYKNPRVSPFAAIGVSAEECFGRINQAVTHIGRMITGRIPIDQMGGMLRIGEQAGIAASRGWAYFINLMALISISLAVMNLLPVPVLDGGHLALYAAEAVRGKPLNPKVLEMAFSAGFFLIAGLMLFLFWNDLRLFGVWRELAGLWS